MSNILKHLRVPLCATKTGKAENAPGGIHGKDGPGAAPHCTLQSLCFQKAWKCLHTFWSDNSREAVVVASLCSLGVCSGDLNFPWGQSR